ncbi:4-alpha-glucanotransferase [Bacteroidia bacterium]|nr:4-alpha-glucanotransferase [Bacteroidia bacterium]
MAYIDFNKDELVDLEYSLHREILQTNRAGGYLSTTIVGCNTRKYHGLLIVPIDEFNGDNHVLLSALDETIIQQGKEFNFGIRRYSEVYKPNGHKYIVDFEYTPVCTWTYRVGGVLLKKELLLVHNESTVLVRYTLLEATSATTLRLRPFLAYRNVHGLTKANSAANSSYKVVENGISMKLYNDFPTLNMQLSKKNEFVAAPDWYYNVEYSEERNRGYDFQEDLLTPGYFDIPIKKGESVIFSASTEIAATARLKAKLDTLVESRPPRDSFEDCLKYSASQFIIKKGKSTEIVAGYPWFGAWGRDTFIALPGLTLAANGGVEACEDVLDTMCRSLRDGLFPNVGHGENAAYNSVDAPMWFFKSLQEYGYAVKDDAQVWKKYGSKVVNILESYKKGVNPYVLMHENGLIWANEPGKALTWMDAIVDGQPVTPRGGYQVEVNALWYNAICYALQLAKAGGDTKFVKAWKELPAKIKESFLSTFWYDEKEYLADFVAFDVNANANVDANYNVIVNANGEVQNVYVRPNQIVAAALEYSPLDDEQKRGVIEVVRLELLTRRGLRTLSPKNPWFQGLYGGSQAVRDSAYHQGTVWPWLIGYYIEANLRLYGKAFVPEAREIIAAFEEEINNYGICSIGEVYDGNPPSDPNGCISQAWSVGEVLRSIALVEKYAKLKNE